MERMAMWLQVMWLKQVRGWWVGMAAALMAGCSPLALVNQFGSDAGFARVETVAYGKLPRQQLDVYVPARPSGKVIVFIYGGSWSSGARADYRFVAQKLTARGATVVVPDYRLYPEIRFPAFVEDVAAAVGWAHKNVSAYAGDPRQIYLVGHSAGAHIAMLLALDARYLAAHQLRPAELAGVVGLSTPADFAATLGARYRPVFTDTAGLDAAQPVRYVNPDAPPLLLLHGADDTLVYPKNSEVLAARQRAAGGRADVVIYPDMSHLGTVAAFISGIGRTEVLARILTFLGIDKAPSAVQAAAGSGSDSD